MDIEISYKDKSLEFNISPYMPIAYIRTLAFKTFKIPEQNIELNFKGIKIEQKYYETYLKDYFPKSLKINIIITENENKNPIKFLLSSTRSTSTFKTRKMEKFYQEKKINLTSKLRSHYDNVLNIDGTKKMKCEECKENEVNYYCREDSKFICSNCKIYHEEHKCIDIKKGNIEQCGYLYKKILINELLIHEENLYSILEKNKSNHLKEYIEELYDIISKLLHLKNDIMDFYPCTPLDKLKEIDFQQFKKDIFSIENYSEEPFNYEDKKKYFKELQKEDFLIDDLKKDIESVQKKYKLQDLILKIIINYLSNLKKLYSDLIKIWKGKRLNILEYTSDLDDLIESQKKIFNLDNNENNLDIPINNSSEYEEYNIEKVLFENKKNKVLPRIKKISNFPVLTNFNSLIKSRNASDNKLNINSYDLDLSSLKTINLSHINNSFKKLKTYKRLLSKRSLNDSFSRLDHILLNEKDLDLYPKIPQRRESIRLSFYTKNKAHKITPADIMKIKKKKKKHF